MRRCDIAETTLQTYLREINRYALLSAEEERALAERVQKGDKQAREEMIRANLRLVVNIARTLSARLRDMNKRLADLSQKAAGAK